MVWVWAGSMENQSKTKSCSEMLLLCVVIKIVTVFFFFFLNSISIILEGLLCILGKKNGNYEVMLKARVKHYL